MMKIRYERSGVSPFIPLALGIAVTLASCGGTSGTERSPDSPQATEFSAGTAHLEVSGDLEASLDLSLATDGASSFEGGVVALAWEDPEGNFMSISATPKNGEADARSDDTPLLATFVVDGKSFNSEATRTCAVSFDQLTSQEASGTLTCEKLRLPVGGSFDAVDVEATFSASRA
jgi:hypothetical protein